MLSAWCTGCNIPVVESCTRQNNKKKEETKQATSLEKYLLPCWYVSKKGCSVNVAMQSVERVLIKEKTTLAADCERQRGVDRGRGRGAHVSQFFLFSDLPSRFTDADEAKKYYSYNRPCVFAFQSAAVTRGIQPKKGV